MKHAFTFLSIAFAMLVLGCRTPYEIHMKNGGVISGVSKPHLDDTGQAYIFKNAAGQTNYVPAMRVQVIQPQERKGKKISTW